MTEPTDGKTFRDLAREGFFGMPAIPLLITDIAMGRTTDRVPTYYERMFLPQYLREAVAKRWGHPADRDLHARTASRRRSDGPSGRGWFALVIILVLTVAGVDHAADRPAASAPASRSR